MVILRGDNMFEQFQELVKRRQSCRDFNDKELDVKIVEQIARLAMLAPSACNSQPWKMYLVTENKDLEGVRNAVQDRGHNKFTDGAKAFIVITEKQATLKETISSKFDRNHFVKYDIGELVAYITLGAESLKVSSCIIGWINQENLRSAVGYSDGEVCNVLVALGYSDIAVREKIRKSEQEIIEIL